MTIPPLKQYTNRNRLLGQLFQISIAFWFFRMVLPGMKYFFIPSFITLVGFVMVFHRKTIFRKEYFFEFLKTFNPLIILGVFFIIPFMFSDKLYPKTIRDLSEYIVNLFFLIVFFALTYRSKRRAGFAYVFNKMTRIIWISAVGVALLGFVKYTLQHMAYSIPFETPYGTAFNEDKNFFALYAMLGIIGLIPRLSKASSMVQRISSLTLLTILVFNIILSFSYRSFILIGLFIVLLFFVQITSFFTKEWSMLKELAKNTRIYSLVVFIVLAFFVYGIQQNDPRIRQVSIDYLSKVMNGKITTKPDVIYADAFNFEKWNYSIELFKQRKTLDQFFGDGFTYLSIFGEYFNANGSYDYPHNPVLSALLYSGIVGAVFIMFFILIAMYYSGKYFKKYPLFSLMLWVSLIFIFFSGNSLFSVPIFLFLFSLAFLIRHQEISELNIILNMHKPGAKFLKETFDYILASLAIVFLFPLLIVLGLAVGFTMGWPVVYTQVRIGQNGKPFKLHKFRSMKKVKSNTTVAAQEQNRITWLGKFMRKYKLDELPELWNIIRGDMSFVGPRPDVPGYADVLQGDDRVILQLKPGLTGAASLKYIHEEEILAQHSNPQQYNDEVIFPDKVRVNKKYMKDWTLWLDLKIIALTGLQKPMHEDKFL